MINRDLREDFLNQALYCLTALVPKKGVHQSMQLNEVESERKTTQGYSSETGNCCIPGGSLDKKGD